MLFSLKWHVKLVVEADGATEVIEGNWVQMVKQLQNYSWGEEIKQDLLQLPLTKRMVQELPGGIKYTMEVH